MPNKPTTLRELWMQQCFCTDKAHKEMGATSECFYDKEKVFEFFSSHTAELLQRLEGEIANVPTGTILTGFGEEFRITSDDIRGAVLGIIQKFKEEMK